MDKIYDYDFFSTKDNCWQKHYFVFFRWLRLKPLVLKLQMHHTQLCKQCIKVWWGAHTWTCVEWISGSSLMNVAHVMEEEAVLTWRASANQKAQQLWSSIRSQGKTSETTGHGYEVCTQFKTQVSHIKIACYWHHSLLIFSTDGGILLTRQIFVPCVCTVKLYFWKDWLPCC